MESAGWRVVAWLAAGILTLGAAGGVRGDTATFSFSAPGGEQTWLVPAGVASVTIDAWGAKGGNADQNGGKGGHVQETYSVTPGETLYIYVGGAGTDGSRFGGNGAAGFNGGGAGGTGGEKGGGGGGGSDVRQSGNTLGHRIIVAAGGGGAGTGGATGGGYGGGTTGGDGGQGGAGDQGRGATQSAGGNGGNNGGSSGGLGVGGNGNTNPHSGGGGGGGLYGGGGGGGGVTGSSGGGAGGGSSWCQGGCTVNDANIQDGHGSVTITYTSPVPDTDSDGVGDPSDLCSGTPPTDAVDANGCADSQVDTDGDGECDPGAPSGGPSGCSGTDGCPSDPDKTEPGQCGCATPDDDDDGDGTANCNDGCPSDSGKTDPGQCGCGVADDDADNDGTADCNDGCPNDDGKTSPGMCGCGTADTDSDNDGTPDCRDVERLLHFQAKLRDGSGAAVNGAMGMTFRFYDAAMGGSLLFTEAHTGVAVSRVLLAVLLGTQTTGGVPDAALERPDVYISVEIGTSGELSPRTRVPASPYAIKAKTAEQLVRPGTLNPALMVDAAGNVGIGTDNPQARLDVNGEVSTGQVGMKWKIFTGVFDSSQNTEIPHDLPDWQQAISVSGFFEYDLGGGQMAKLQMSIQLRPSVIFIPNSGSVAGRPYSVLLFYTD